jgi:aminoglycoside 6'-N-acetyltransferase
VERLREHNVTLRGERLALRPMTERDWDVLSKWDTDPEVVYYSEGDWVDGYDLETTQMIYRGVSQNAFNFIAELDGRPIGYCWLQTMNLERVLSRLPGKDLRRIDLAIGEKELWGQGLGTEIIRTLTEFGFEREHADAIFGCSIGDYNPRSRRAFERNGYTLFIETPQPEGSKAKVEYDLMLGREDFSAALD